MMPNPDALKKTRIAGVGSYLPEKRWNNNELAEIKNLDTSDEWIKQRTGIEYRHIAADNEHCSDLGVMAAKNALNHAEITKDQVDLIIVATTTADNFFPATATRIQHKLDIAPCPAFDVQAVCSGFIFALTQADNMIKLGQATTALVIGTEVYSRMLDWQDRTSCILFGDGAGAVILQAGDKNIENTGILGHYLCSDGKYYDHLLVQGGVGSLGAYGHVKMDGKEVYRHAVEKMADAVLRACADQSITTDTIDWLIPHQANKRIIDKVGQRLNIPSDKVVITVERHANTSAATIPLALDHAVRNGNINKGDLVACTAMGGGFSWGASLFRW